MSNLTDRSVSRGAELPPVGRLAEFERLYRAEGDGLRIATASAAPARGSSSANPAAAPGRRLRRRLPVGACARRCDRQGVVLLTDAAQARDHVGVQHRGPVRSDMAAVRVELRQRLVGATGRRARLHAGEYLPEAAAGDPLDPLHHRHVRHLLFPDQRADALPDALDRSRSSRSRASGGRHSRRSSSAPSTGSCICPSGGPGISAHRRPPWVATALRWVSELLPAGPSSARVESARESGAAISKIRRWFELRARLDRLAGGAADRVQQSAPALSHALEACLRARHPMSAKALQ